MKRFITLWLVVFALWASIVQAQQNAIPVYDVQVRQANGKIAYSQRGTSSTTRGTALIAAIAAAADGDKILIGPGTFDVDTTALDLSAAGTKSISLEGVGIGVTVVESDTILGTHGVAIKPGTSSTVSNLTINLPLSGQYQAGFGIHNSATTPQSGQFSKARLINVEIIGDSDAIYINDSNNSRTYQIDCYDCVFRTKWDSVALFGSTDTTTRIVRLFNCRVLVTGPTSITPAQQHCLLADGGGTIEAVGCDLINVGTNAVDNRTVRTYNTQGKIVLRNCRVSSTGAANNYDLYNNDFPIAGPGTLEVHGGRGSNSDGSYTSSGSASNYTFLDTVRNTVPNSAGLAILGGTGTSANLAANISDENGSGKAIFSAGTLDIASGKTATISNTLTFTGTDSSSVAFGAGGTIAYVGTANSWGDGIKQTFNPSGTTAGFNFGSHAGDPSSPANGDAWYNSSAETLYLRLNGASVGLSSSGGNLALGPFSSSGTFAATAITVPFSGFGIYDADVSHTLSLLLGTNLSDNRTLTITPGDASRTITLSGNPTLSDWFDQSVKSGTSPTFTGTNFTGVPISTGISGLGTNQATALATNLAASGTNRKSQILLTASGGANPADGQTLYFGTPNFAATTASGTYYRYYFKFACHIKSASIQMVTASTLGSGETGEVYIRLNNTTDTLVSNAVTVTANQQKFDSGALDVAVAAGDYIEGKWVNPTYATNPTGVVPNLFIEIEAD